MPQNLIVLLGGGHAAGKATTAELIRKEIEKLPFYSVSSLHIEVVSMLEYEDHSINSKGSATTEDNPSKYNFKPARFDFDALKTRLENKLKSRDEVQKLVIVHGLYALYNKEICNLSHMKVYIDSDADTRLIRWIRRDVLAKLGGKLEDVIWHYLNGARQEMTDYIFPTKERADVIMPRGAEANGVSLIVDGLLPHIGYGKFLESAMSRRLRPFQNERFDSQKGNYYELN